jgi:hypothetical protein
MKKLFLLMAAPVLFSLGCGGIDCVVSPNDPSCLSDVFQVQDGNYKQSNTSTITSTCLATTFDPTTARTALEGTLRHVYNAGTGEICIESVPAAGMQPVKIGCGMVRQNKGTLTSLIAYDDGVCQWTANTSIDLKVTAKNSLSFTLSQQRVQYKSTTAGSCKQTTDCTVGYSANLAM